MQSRLKEAGCGARGLVIIQESKPLALRPCPRFAWIAWAGSEAGAWREGGARSECHLSAGLMLRQDLSPLTLELEGRREEDRRRAEGRELAAQRTRGQQTHLCYMFKSTMSLVPSISGLKLIRLLFSFWPCHVPDPRTFSWIFGPYHGLPKQLWSPGRGKTKQSHREWDYRPAGWCFTKKRLH